MGVLPVPYAATDGEYRYLKIRSFQSPPPRSFAERRRFVLAGGASPFLHMVDAPANEEVGGRGSGQLPLQNFRTKFLPGVGTQNMFVNVVFRYYSSPRHTVYARRVDSSALAFSLSSHRHSSISLLFSVRLILS